MSFVTAVSILVLSWPVFVIPVILFASRYEVPPDLIRSVMLPIGAVLLAVARATPDFGEFQPLAMLAGAGAIFVGAVFLARSLAMMRGKKLKRREKPL